DVQSPVRFPGGAEIQTLGNGAPQRLPGGANVAGPGGSSVAVLAGVGRPSHINHALVLADAALALPNPARMQQGERADVARIEISLRFPGVERQPFVRLMLHRAMPFRF